MWAHIERSGRCERQCSGMIRVFDDEQQMGDPYRYAFAFHMVADDTIELIGVTGRTPTKSEVWAMIWACDAAGLKVRWNRRCGARKGIRSPRRKGM